MRIAYVTTYDASDVHAWSGSGYYILKALQTAGIETDLIGNLREGDWYRSKIKKLYYSRLMNRQFTRDREPAILKNYAAQVEQRLASINPDVVFSPGTLPLAYLQTKKPLVFWTDATFAGMIDFYPWATNLCAESIRNGNKMEQLALTKCRLAIFSSEWAARTAIDNYDVDPKKIKVVPFGANIDHCRGIQEVDQMVNEKKLDVCKLLFLGVDWSRKGGGKAVAVAGALNRRGLRAELHVVGCHPPPGAPPYVKEHGFLSKRTAEGRAALNRLFSECHFLILPTIADCVPVVLAEACSFGLPCLTTKVGGIPTTIVDGRNGWTFHLEASPEEYCEYIENLMRSREDYRRLSLSCWQEYSERLNWDSAGVAVLNFMQELCLSQDDPGGVMLPTT